MAPSRGALVTSFSVAGREVLFLDEATFVDTTKNVRGGVPVLFPSPGRLAGDAFSRGGRSGSLPQHGFARNRAFAVQRRDDAEVELRLVSDEATRAAFPWGFSLALCIAVEDAAFVLRATITSRAAEPMPYALGYHPYFAVAAADRARVRVPTAARRAFDNVQKRDVDLDEIRFGDTEVDLHLSGHGGSTASLELPDGVVTLAGDSAFERWVVWALPGRDFVCLEPWTAPANALVSGEGLRSLEPGASETLSLRVSFAARA